MEKTKINVMITAGGTSEPIDNVRRIANTGTGRLGSIIADAFAAEEGVDKIFFVCARDSANPTSRRVTRVEIGTVADLQAAVTRLMKEQTIHAVVHSMAVSDYTVRSVSTAEELAAHLPEGGRVTGEDVVRALDETDIRTSEGKLSSQMDSPVLLLKKTPKIIPMFRNVAPKAVIVGFKLLSRVTKEELIDTARRLLHKNGCDFVLANDASEIRGDDHHAYLIDEKQILCEMETKQEIAWAIKEMTMKEARSRL